MYSACFLYWKNINTRIWCNWCSIADFSSVRTGSSPVIRYEIINILRRSLYSIIKNGKTNFCWFICCFVVMSFNLLFTSDYRIVLKSWLVWASYGINKKWLCCVWVLYNCYLISYFVWCSSCFKTYYRNNTSIINLWGDGRAVNCIRL